MPAICSSSEPYGWCSSTGGRSLKNFGDNGDARILRHLKEKDDRLLSLTLPQWGFIPTLARILRLRHRTNKMTTIIKATAPPAAMPTRAAVLRVAAFFEFFSVSGSTTEMSHSENTESLMPKSSVVLGLCLQPASRATSARTSQHKACGQSGLGTYNLR